MSEDLSDDVSEESPQQFLDETTTVPLELALVVRDVRPEDLVDLGWSGGPAHIDALASALQRSYAGEVALVMIIAPNGNSIAVGGVDFTRRPGGGELWMLSVLGGWQSLGVGSILIGALEDRVRRRGLPRATLSVEHDNPRAEALYRRLGYNRTGTELDGWSIGPARSYATVCFTMAKPLYRPDRRGPADCGRAGRLWDSGRVPFEIPSDLNPDLVALAWMIGSWEGSGKSSYPGTEDTDFGQRIDISHNGGSYLHYLSQTYEVDAGGQPVRPLSMETGFWRPQRDASLEVVMTNPEGWVEVWYGNIQGAKIEIRTDAVVRTASAPDYTAGHRLYGNVESDLLWTFDRAADGQPLQSYQWGRLRRVS